MGLNTAIKRALIDELTRQAESDGYFVRQDDERYATIDGSFDLDALAETMTRTPPEIDWRKILKVYLAATPHTEIITFIDTIRELTVDERIALLSADAEATGENRCPATRT